METIKSDLTEILNGYCDWDSVVRKKYINYASKLIDEQKVITYKDIDYHNIEDLMVDLEAECLQRNVMENPRQNNFDS